MNARTYSQFALNTQHARRTNKQELKLLKHTYISQVRAETI